MLKSLMSPDRVFKRLWRRSPEYASPKRKHRIALVLNDMNATGGIQRVAANLARDLHDDFDTVIVTVFSLENVVFDEPNIVIKSLNLPYIPGKFYPRFREAFRIGRSLRRLILDEGIDTVICFWWHWAIIAAIALPRSVKTIGYEHIAFSGAGRFWGRLRRLVYPYLDAVVSLAEEDRAKFASISRLARVIPNYVPLPDADPTRSREKILLAVGHVVHRKGIDRLLWALKETLHANPDWKLAIVGGEGHLEYWYFSYLHALTGLLHLSDRVEVFPATTRIEEWYQRASIMLMGSRLEGFPMVLLEAKSHGLPVVSFDCPTGPKEIVQHETDGFLANDRDEFAAAVQLLMVDPDMRERMGKAAVEDVRSRFSVERARARWCDLIQTIHQGS